MIIDIHKLCIVKYAPADVEVLHDIVAECGVDMLNRYGLTHWYPPYPIETMRRNARELNVYGVHYDAQVIGTFTVGTSGWKYDDSLWANVNHQALYLGKLAIRPAWQGGGIGRWCVRKVEELAESWGCQAVRFDAIARHTRLVAFYEKLRYVARGQGTVIDWRGVEWEVVYLERILAGN